MSLWGQDRKCTTRQWGSSWELCSVIVPATLTRGRILNHQSMKPIGKYKKAKCGQWGKHRCNNQSLVLYLVFFLFISGQSLMSQESEKNQDGGGGEGGHHPDWRALEHGSGWRLWTTGLVSSPFVIFVFAVHWETWKLLESQTLHFLHAGSESWERGQRVLGWESVPGVPALEGEPPFSGNPVWLRDSEESPKQTPQHHRSFPGRSMCLLCASWSSALRVSEAYELSSPNPRQSQERAQRDCSEYYFINWMQTSTDNPVCTLRSHYPGHITLNALCVYSYLVIMFEHSRAVLLKLFGLRTKCETRKSTS